MELLFISHLFTGPVLNGLIKHMCTIIKQVSQIYDLMYLHCNYLEVLTEVFLIQDGRSVL